MGTQVQKARLAVYIDAENISPKFASRLFRDIGERGEAIIRRIYGNFSTTDLEQWKVQTGPHGLHQRHVHPVVKGKNSADIMMVIDAMEAFHAGTVDGFCIVSSDSDFRGLAEWIRERGKKVYGYGDTKTPIACRKAFTEFVDVGAWGEAAKPPIPVTIIAPAIAKPAPKPKAAPSPAKATKAKVAAKRQPPANAVVIISDCIAGMAPPSDGWVELGVLGSKLRALPKPFTAKSCGYAQLGTLIKETGSFESKLCNKKPMVRIKPASLGKSVG